MHDAEQEKEHASEAPSAPLDALDRHDETDPVHTRRTIDDLTVHHHCRVRTRTASTFPAVDDSRL
ncbi:hypothetical protein ACFQZ2_06125 [Streptomonospora algeriensis]|uniref:Uncharacterized protein n=1 Tax=Streptomonospora algeriensis TaxID=995084 RepID=A0ABW3BD54_9ACTN